MSKFHFLETVYATTDFSGVKTANLEDNLTSSGVTVCIVFSRPYFSKGRAIGM